MANMEQACSSLSKLLTRQMHSQVPASSLAQKGRTKLMDKVPVEIRLRIFGLALQTETGYVKIIDRREPWEQNVKR